jgi:hypothetical protein
MRKITCYIDAEVEDIEVDDNASAGEIQAEYEYWMEGKLKTGWYETKEE